MSVPELLALLATARATGGHAVLATLTILPALALPAPADAGPLADKAAGYGVWTPTWHRQGYGAITDIDFTDESLTAVAALGGRGDSTIWTGTYLGAVALRLLETGDPEALAEVLSTQQTLHHHLRVTGRTGFIARFRGPNVPPYNAGFPGEHWYEGQGDYAGDVFLTNTSRDQYTGWFFGMALAYDALEGRGHDDVRAQIGADVAEVVDTLIAQDWLILDLDGVPTTAAPNVLLPQQAAWSIIAAHVTGGAQRFWDEYHRIAAPENHGKLRLASISFLNKYVQHYGNNLAHTNFYNLMRLANAYGLSDDYGFWTRLFRSQVHPWWHLVHNPWFETIHWSVLARPDEEARAQIAQDLSDFRAAPNLRIAPVQPEVELDPFSLWLVDLQEQYPWLRELIGTARPQALEPFPVPLQCPSDFLFQRSPWAVGCGTSDLRHAAPGVDYLVTYWLARRHGVIGAAD